LHSGSGRFSSEHRGGRNEADFHNGDDVKSAAFDINVCPGLRGRLDNHELYDAKAKEN